MSGPSWILWLLASVVGAVFVLWLYRRRETPGRGRGALAALRSCTIALLLLLAFDPDLPGAVRTGGRDVVIVDASLSMRLPGPSATLWETAVSRARATGLPDVTIFGDGARTAPIDSIGTIIPAATHSRLLPALQAVAEAGFRSATVITDGAIEDADEVRRWLPRLGIDVTMDTVSSASPNRGLARVSAPAFAATGDPITIEFDLRAAGTANGPVSVVASRDGTEVGRTIVETPASGRVATGTLTFTAGDAPPNGYTHYEVRIEADDAVGDDDARSVYVNVTDEPAGAVLVSFRPDWEPRFLQPVLERSLGVPVRGYLRTGTEWVMLGSGMAGGARVDDTEVQRAVDRAEMLILHGFGSASPQWARDAAASASRILVLPAGDGDVPAIPVPPTSAVPGDWYLSPEVPPSPVAHLFAGIDATDVPPLQALRTPGSVPGTWWPAVVSRGRRGAPYPVAVGGTTDGRRWVVALGEGYWRWAFWSDDARDVYERLWSALGSWVLGDVVAAGPDAVAPVTRVIERGAQPAWVAFGFVPDSMRVRLTDTATGETTDTLLTGLTAGPVSTAALSPGTSIYDVSAWSGDNVATGRGEITIESYSAEFTRGPTDARSIESALNALGPSGRSRLPLHASVWPYAMLVVLLSLEWVLRRRWGLR